MRIFWFFCKFIVDDVWSGGTAEEATKSGYLLMSECIKQGLYHPNCKDSHTTYFGDILDEDEDEQTEVTPNDERAFTPEEQKLSEQLYEAEQRENYCERQAERFERLSEYSLDEGNRKMYRARKNEWGEKLSITDKTVSEIKEKIYLNEEKQVPAKVRNTVQKHSAAAVMIGRGNVADVIQKLSFNTDNSEEKEEKRVANSVGSGIINTRALADRDMASGMRKSAKIQLSDEDKKHLLSEIDSIQVDRNVFVFRDGFGSGYSDERDKVFVSSNIFPSNDGSTHHRDLMSERAALAHEYYGHRANRGTTLSKGSWNDEFRASYMAAKNCPNLSDEDKYYLILDALERAKEQGVSIKYNDFIRGILYGY